MSDLVLVGLGPWEIAGIVIVVLVVFGAGRLAGVGKALGQGLREFREEAKVPPGEESDKTSVGAASGSDAPDEASKD